MYIGSEQTTAGVESIMESASLVNELVRLTESESTYEPEMVPIRENQRLGKNLIRLEDLVEYAIANGITDAGYAINSICEASEISPDSIAFSVNEENMATDQELFDTVKAFVNENATVLVSPVCTRE